MVAGRLAAWSQSWRTRPGSTLVASASGPGTASTAEPPGRRLQRNEAALIGTVVWAVCHRRPATAALAGAGGAVVAGSAASYLYSTGPGKRAIWGSPEVLLPALPPDDGSDNRNR
jgi:hypothetical protein